MSCPMTLWEGLFAQFGLSVNIFDEPRKCGLITIAVLKHDSLSQVLFSLCVQLPEVVQLAWYPLPWSSTTCP